MCTPSLHPHILSPESSYPSLPDTPAPSSSLPSWAGALISHGLALFLGVQAEEFIVTPLVTLKLAGGGDRMGACWLYWHAPTLRCPIPGYLLLGGCLWVICWVLPERQG